ncbi:putative tRNA (guanine-N(1)-)-methyltransferase [Glarea lozoyensis 74030]|uniref:tRNA (guanine(9)-N1)-methyltransferase n=1 Tax=Glarea lozoyensis (strain ATCC 74030 / MF5533) TaxID=1104152 RepID=H0EFL3_GLAL7|nr:putative tRNA (guanine-N(1)-)-methyltransferase [Glarea lozoyensis 74030]
MSDLEERPSKIRKVNPSEESAEAWTGIETPVTDAEQQALEEKVDPTTTTISEDEDPTTNFRRPRYDIQIEYPPGISKSQRKKLARKAEWEAGKVLDEVMRGKEGGVLAGALAETIDGVQESSERHSVIENVAPIEQLEDTKPKLVYLSSDSPNTLERLSPNTSYIIGGIVDKNRHKGLCYKKACERGIPTAKLPIGEFLTMQSRTVLTVNHVVEIMLKWLETGDWGEAFLKVIPKRKEAKLKTTRSESENKDDEDSEGEQDVGEAVPDGPQNSRSGILTEQVKPDVVGTGPERQIATEPL